MHSGRQILYLLNDTKLSALNITGGILNPVFDNGSLNYTVNVVNSVASIKVTPTAEESNATIKVNGTILASGTESQDIALSVGGNTINVEVTAQDGITKEIYVINVTRAEPPVQQYTVTYSTNGGTGNVPVDTSSPYNAGSLVTVLDKGSILKDGCTFAGWNTKANGSGTAYAAGSQLTISRDTTLYAQWTPNPAPSNDAKLGGLNNRRKS